MTNCDRPPQSLAPWIEAIRIELRRLGLPAAALQSLPYLAVFDDIRFENYDCDLIGSEARRLIHHALQLLGFQRRSGHLYAHPSGVLARIPKPSITLGTNPVDAVHRVSSADSVILVTPTQLLLLALDRPDFSVEEAVDELQSLLRLCPANLPKVVQWTRARGRSKRLRNIYPLLCEAQHEAIRKRKARDG